MTTIKRTLCAVLAAAMLVLLFGCANDASVPVPTAGADATAPAETANTEADFTLKLGFDAEFPPYGYLDENGEYAGFDIDMAKELCSRLGWGLQLIPINWDSKDFELESGAIDCIWNGFTMNGREELYTWSDAYMDNSQVFIVKSDSGITDKAGLAGKTVAVQKESATAMDIGGAKYQIQGKESEYTILDEAIQSEQYAIGFYLGNTELRDKVQAELDKMAADGTFAKISENWFGYDVCILDE